MHSFLLKYSLLLCLALLSEEAAGQTAQDGWRIPASPDFAVTLYNQETVPVSWKGWEEAWVTLYLDSVPVNDLWVTSSNYHEVPFSQLLTENINVTQPGSFTWKLNISDDDLSRTAKYTLRFKNKARSYDPRSAELSSPGFIVLNERSSKTSRVETSTTARPTTSGLPISSTLQSSLPSATPPAESSGLSTGAKAGIGVGSAIAVLALVGAAISLYLRRRRQSPNVAENPKSPTLRPALAHQYTEPDYPTDERPPPAELLSTYLPPSELPPTYIPPSELPGRSE